MLNSAHPPINNNIINSNNPALTPPVQSNNSASPKSSSSSNSSAKDLKQPANLSGKPAYSSAHSINHTQQQQQLINQQTANHTSPGHQNRLLHNSTNLSVATSPQITPLAYPLSTLAWMSSARGKPRRGMMRRAVFSDAQRQGLEKRFQAQKYISKPDRKKLADDLGLKDAQVKIWFQNR